MTATPNTKSTRKEAAVSFLSLVVAGRIREAYERHVDVAFRHHHPSAKGDMESLIVAMEQNEGQFPGKVLEVQHALEDGDLVAVHSRLQLKPGGLQVAVVHLLRFQGDRIVELWDLGQPVPKGSPNENGMF